jgi:hypothetical protein
MKLLTAFTLLTLSLTMTGCTGLGRAMPLTVQWKTPNKVNSSDTSEEVVVESVDVEEKLDELNVDIQDPQVRQALKEMLAGASTPEDATTLATPSPATNLTPSTVETPEQDSNANNSDASQELPSPPQSGQRRSLEASGSSSSVPSSSQDEKTSGPSDVSSLPKTTHSKTTLTSESEIATTTDTRQIRSLSEPSLVANASHETPVIPAPDSTAEPGAESIPAKGAWKGQLGELIKALEDQLALRQETLTEGETEHLETVLSLLYLLSNDRDTALETLDFTEPEKEAFWKELVFAVSVILEPEELDVDAPFFVGDHRRASLALAHLRKAEEGLSPLASLQVNNITLCEEVKGFGNYVAFPSASFEPGQATIVYCEIENYKTTQAAGPRGLGPQYESEFQSSISIVNEDRQVVRQFTYQPIVDTARNRRRDFYIHYTLTIPDDLPRGNYSISLQVEDVKAGKTTQSPPVPFRVR